MNKYPFTIDEIKNHVRQLDETVSEERIEFKAATVLLSALQVGQDVRTLAIFTGYEMDLIQVFAHRLRIGGVWLKDGQFNCDWEGEDGGVALWMDAMVATGYMHKIGEAWKISDSGRAAARRLKREATL